MAINESGAPRRSRAPNPQGNNRSRNYIDFYCSALGLSSKSPNTTILTHYSRTLRLSMSIGHERSFYEH